MKNIMVFVEDFAEVKTLDKCVYKHYNDINKVIISNRRYQ